MGPNAQGALKVLDGAAGNQRQAPHAMALIGPHSPSPRTERAPASLLGASGRLVPSYRAPRFCPVEASGGADGGSAAGRPHRPQIGR